MKATLISMLAVVALAAGICIFSVMRIGQVTDEMEQMRTEVMKLSDAGEIRAVQERLRQMTEKWSGEEAWLAMLVSHEQLHEITDLLIEGDANLKADDLDDFSRSMALLGEAIDHFYEEERLRLANIL